MQWPKQDYSSLTKFFGEPGENQILLPLPFPMRLAWETESIVKRISCNEKVAEPLKRIFTAVLNHYGLEEIKRLRLDLFGGCLNVRKMRGGNAWSTHSWGIAVDIDPDNNQLKWGKDKATLAKAEYEAFWKIVEGEGAISLGRAKNYDWMHFQFASL